MIYILNVQRVDVAHLDHVVLWDALCDADDEGHLRLNRLEDSRRRARRRHVQNSRVRARLLLCFGDRCKDRLPEENSNAEMWGQGACDMWEKWVSGWRHQNTCPRCVVPAFLGLTPPTICVPYAIACSQWKVPVFPVNPWQMTFVCLKTAGGGGFACGTRGNRQSGWKGAGERSERDLAHGGWASVGARSHNTHLRREASTQHRSHAARGTVGQHWPA